jgi:hypothetical protein
MRKPFAWLGPARLLFLVLTPACIVLGVACVHWTQGHVNRADALDQRAPFGAGGVVQPAHPERAGVVPMALGIWMS